MTDAELIKLDDDAIARELFDFYLPTWLQMTMAKAVKKALAIGRCQEFEQNIEQRKRVLKASLGASNLTDEQFAKQFTLAESATWQQANQWWLENAHNYQKPGSLIIDIPAVLEGFAAFRKAQGAEQEAAVGAEQAAICQEAWKNPNRGRED